MSFIGLDSVTQEGANILLDQDAQRAENQLIGWTKNVADWIGVMAPNSGLQAAWYAVNPIGASLYNQPIERVRAEVRARLEWLHRLPTLARVMQVSQPSSREGQKVSVTPTIRHSQQEEPQIATAKARDSLGPVAGRKVFLVHGHDEAAKQATARFLEKLRLEPIILHEQPSEGRTVIEKVEAHAGVAFAVVLLTPDDVGAKLGGEPAPRARQNVVLELGYFLGRLGRKHVAALIRGNVEIASDYDGVVYIEMDDAGAWRLALAKELKAAGLNVDLNDVT